MLKQITIASLILLAPAAVGVATAGPSASAATAPAQMGELRLRADLEGRGRASGDADYRERLRGGTVVRRFSVEIEDAAPNTVYDIAHNGKVIGRVKTNSFGFGDFNRRTLGDDSGKVGPIPTMSAGDVIEVVGLGISGALR